MSAGSYIYSSKDWSPNDPKEIVVNHILNNQKILDVGCGVGGFGQWLIKNKRATVDGVDYHPEAVREAKTVLTSAKCVDLNDPTKIRDALKGKKYDMITLIDVLEHCLYPGDVLEVLSQHLEDNGNFIVSIPNSAHYSVRTMVLRGHFHYQDSGIMDKTHVHFYTQESIEQLLKKAMLKTQFLGYTFSSRRTEKILGRLFPRLFAIQCIYSAYKQ